VFNVGTAVETSILDLAKLMIEISGSRSTIRFVDKEDVYGTSYEDIARRVPDNARMRKVLGVDTEVPLRDGLKRTIDWFRSQTPSRRAGITPRPWPSRNRRRWPRRRLLPSRWTSTRTRAWSRARRGCSKSSRGTAYVRAGSSPWVPIAPAVPRYACSASAA